jgi:dolichyl-phosphate beta-glucosyltransferase
MPRPALSIVIPAYDEARRIGPTLDATCAYLDARGLDDGSVEVLVVDDGSRDETASIVEGRSMRDERVQLVRMSANRGKGAAVREGMLRSRGERALFMDADLATPIEELTKLERALDGGADVAIGSRALAASRIEVRQHPTREAMGKAFNLLVRTLAMSGIRDTQCGFKLFTRPAADALFGEARVDRFAFDVEVLLLARGRFRVVEVPVVWRHIEQSKISPLRDAARMAFDLVKIRVDVATRRRG